MIVRCLGWMFWSFAAENGKNAKRKQTKRKKMKSKELKTENPKIEEQESKKINDNERPL